MFLYHVPTGETRRMLTMFLGNNGVKREGCFKASFTMSPGLGAPVPARGGGRSPRHLDELVRGRSPYPVERPPGRDAGRRRRQFSKNFLSTAQAAGSMGR